MLSFDIMVVDKLNSRLIGLIWCDRSLSLLANMLLKVTMREKVLLYITKVRTDLSYLRGPT